MEVIVVCGAGTMGSGIVQTAAQAGFSVILYDLEDSVLIKAKASIAKGLDAFVEKGRISASDADAAMKRTRFTSNLNDCVGDLVIEAIIERMEIKQDLFRRLEEINSDEALLTTNTSSLSVSKIAAGMKRPGRFAGLHFFNPAPLMKLVEIVRGDQTFPGVTERLGELVKRLGKTPVVCRDSPGFIVNRVARPFYIESLRLYEQGLLSIEQLDSLLEGSGFRMGPFKLMDLIGNDVNYAVSCSVYEQLGRPGRLRPSVIQQNKVELGELGRKTGKGYYSY